MNEGKLMLLYRGNPLSAASYESGGGYQALRQAVRLSPPEVIAELEKRRLVGRGGAAFSTARKWQFVAQAQGTEKYIICNADEGEPGTFKDKALLEHAPLSVLEGMALAAYATGARQGFLFLRGEYRALLPHLEDAIAQAQAHGCLGQGILGVEGFDFTVRVIVSAGAYVCGEETALLNAIAGGRGEPRLRPPYPAAAGLYGKPTLINNTETFAQAAALCTPVEDYLAMGDSISGGTKLISLSGMVCNPGVYEIPIGKIPLKALIFSPEFGGGLRTGRPLQFYHLGGQSGVVGFPEQIHTPFGYAALQEAGLSIGSGSIAVYDDTVSPVEYCWHVMDFFAHESCGKCLPCLLGTERARQMLDALRRGGGDVDSLAALVENIEKSAFCGLGQSVGKALRSFLKFRRSDFCSRANQ